MREKIGQPEIRSDSFCLEAFKNYFPEAGINEISMSEVPENAMEYFENKSKQFVSPEDYMMGNFNKFYIIKMDDGDLIYAANQTKTYVTNGHTEELTYFFDIRNGENIGYSELRFNLSNDSEYFKDKPFIGYIKTEKDLKKTGLGTRRMMAMNAIAQALYKNPLYSDTVNSDEMINLWEDLVKKGKAMKFKEGDFDRYFMK